MEDELSYFGILKDMEKSVFDKAHEHNLDAEQVIWILSNIIGGLAVDGTIIKKYENSTK